jgi:hypothetical protein
MSDVAPIADTQKTPPPDPVHAGADATKASDSTKGASEGDKGQGAIGWMMSEVHGEWDSLKKTLGISSDTAKPETGGTVDMPNIFPAPDKNAASGTPAAAEIKAAAATSIDNKTADNGAAQPEHHWWDGISSMGHAIAGAVEKSWDALSDKVDDTYKSILADSDNKTTHVDAKIGADGKPEYFQQTSDNGVRQLSDGEQRYTDAKGGTIIKNTKTGEITSQSADGDDIYTKKADGTEIYRSKNIEYTKNKDGTYEARDDKGNVTEVSDKGAITKIDGIFTVAQRITSIDATTAKPAKGQLETMTDGQRYMDRAGDVIVARNNGDREVTTADGQHFRFDRDHKKIEIEENGKWRTLTRQEFEGFRHCHMGQGGQKGQAGNDIQVGGVKVGPDGKVSTDDKVTLGEQAGVGAKMVATVPTEGGKPAVVTTNPDHTSTLDLNNHLTRVNPDDKTHLVERFSENADGTLGASDFCYNSQDQSFWTPDLTWTPDGTYMGWNDTFLDPLGTLSTYDDNTIFDGSPDAVRSSATQSEQSCRNADNAVASVTSKIGSQSLDAADLAALNSSLGDLDGALNVAMTAGNFSAACQIIQAKGEVATAISEASQQVALSDLMRSGNMSEGDIVSAADEVSSRGVQGAAVSQEVQVLGPNAQTFEGRLAYMSEFGISGLTDEQKRQLTA